MYIIVNIISAPIDRGISIKATLMYQGAGQDSDCLGDYETSLFEKLTMYVGNVGSVCPQTSYNLALSEVQPLSIEYTDEGVSTRNFPYMLLNIS